MIREAISTAHRVVVKVGSSSLTSSGRLDPERLDRLVDALAAQRTAGRQVVLVSSGAIAAGIEPLGLRARPRDLATQQAAASVGQLLLVERYAASFARHGLRVGQVLLTADDLDRRGHYRNANRTLERLLALGIAPIVNENDTVATHEIRFGDNDRLAALVAHLVHADALVLLSDVDGLYTGNPRRPEARLVAEVRGPEDLADVDTRGSGSGVGLGGMATKIEAAVIATGAGIPVLLAAATSVGEALAGPDRHVLPSGRRPDRITAVLAPARVHAARTADTGSRGHSRRCEPPGIAASGRHHRGERGFRLGDPVDLATADGTVVARGLVGYDAADLPSLLGRKTGELPAEFRRAVVHRDDLALFR